MEGNNMKSKIRRILKEDIHQMMLDKMSKMVRLPYYDFLKKNGITDDDAEIILTKHFKDKFGDGEVTFEIKPSDEVKIKLFKSDDGNSTLYEYREYSTDYDDDDDIAWSFYKTFRYEDLRSGGGRFFYYIDDEGKKEYCWSQENTCYDNYNLNNWNDHHNVESLNKNEFFNIK